MMTGKMHGSLALRLPSGKGGGEEYGLNVILGMELRFPENESDYLIYGIDEKWVYGHPWINRMDHQTFSIPTAGKC